MRPEPSRANDQKVENFRALCTRRRQTQDRTISHMIKQCIAFLNKQLEAMEAAIDTMIRQDDDWRRRREIIESIPGFAAMTARSLIADLPELGSITNK